MGTKRYIFISYSSSNRQVAQLVYDTLTEEGFNCWMAPQSIPPGDNYASVIPNAIENCTVFVLVLSKESQESIWVPRELDKALTCRKIIIPYNIDMEPLSSNFSFYLSNIQRIEAYKDTQKSLKKLIEQVRNNYGEIVENITPIPIQSSFFVKESDNI